MHLVRWCLIYISVERSLLYMDNIEILVAGPEHEVYVDTILDTIAEAAKVRGTGIAKRTHEYLTTKMKEAKAATMNSNYVYVLPNVTMYKRVSTPHQIKEMMQVPGFLSIQFSGNME